MSEKMVIGEVVALDQLWMSKEQARLYFGYEEHESTFQKLLSEFKSHSDFKEGYRLVTYKVPTIRIDLFDQFLDWKHKNQFRKGKGA
ncbi:hypothetical protein [Candidatus Enterococcus ferrettii]|uniref:Excisionase n=1 Tax=Candidatus Enterococcus ferrettii TaxID=2815324 RepID=A0ABV0EI43_9ENTE|nr:hypothetical protein [Enterococcus sp. 665A]